jgi:imidazolonepropionase-like amidohydrolase
MEIMREGGGIGFTVEQTKLATDEELLASLIARLKRMLCAGKIFDLLIVLIIVIIFLRYNSC